MDLYNTQNVVTSHQQIARRALRQRPAALKEKWRERFNAADTDNVHQKSCNCSVCRTTAMQETAERGTYSQANAEFPDEILISSTFGDITKDYINWPSNETLTYTIYDRERSNRRITTNSHSAEEENFIHGTVDEVDSIIGLDFEYSRSFRESEIVFISVDEFRPWNDSVAGQVIETRSRWLVLWRDYTPNSDDLIDYDKNTIVHEFGHALGLSHPAEMPSDPNYNTVDDTIMSYNSFNGDWGTQFTSNDLEALQMIWGVE